MKVLDEVNTSITKEDLVSVSIDADSLERYQSIANKKI